MHANSLSYTQSMKNYILRSESDCLFQNLCSQHSLEVKVQAIIFLANVSFYGSIILHYIYWYLFMSHLFICWWTLDLYPIFYLLWVMPDAHLLYKYLLSPIFNSLDIDLEVESVNSIWYSQYLASWIMDILGPNILNMEIIRRTRKIREEAFKD